MRKKLYIVGAGGFGREVMNWALGIPEAQRDWDLTGFLNSIPTALDGFDTPYRIIADADHFEFAEDDRLICAIGDPAGKYALCTRLRGKGARFITLCHKDTIVSPSVIFEQGCIICPHVVVGPGVRVGSFSTILGSTVIESEAVLGEGVTVSAFSSIGEGAVIGDGVFFGSHAVVLPGTKIGKGAIIGARTVVSGEIPTGATFFGIPGRMINGFEE